MKTGATILAVLLSLCLPAFAQQAFLAPSNPLPKATFVWDPSPSPGVTGYNLYYGVGNRQYTNMVPVGNATTYTLTLPARGVNFFFAVTATAPGLESEFSNEVSYQAPAPPIPPNQKPVVVLVVQSKPATGGQWADAGMDWTLRDDQATQVYRLKMAMVSQKDVSKVPSLKSKVSSRPPSLPKI